MEKTGDLCNNGKNNEHGGWKRTGNKRKFTTARRITTKSNMMMMEYYDCEELKKDNHWHYEYEWKYECCRTHGGSCIRHDRETFQGSEFPGSKRREL